MELIKIMKIKMKYIFVLSVAFIFVIFFAGCSDLKEDIPAVPQVYTHGTGNFDSSSANYHPYLIANSKNGIYDCQTCHAADFSGGVTGVGCNTPNCHPSIGVHLAGIVDTTSQNFHGNFIKDHEWDMRPCKSCHGEMYSGGLVSPSCNDCHVYINGPENCTTCHGSKTSNAPPKDLNGNYSTSDRGVGAHQAHLKENNFGRYLTCTECHVVPGATYVQGHIDGDNRAEVLMNKVLANLVTNDPSTTQYDSSLTLFTPSPNYNLETLTCSNTYCHGYFKNGNLDNSPIWNNSSTAACGTCHGDETSPLPKTDLEGGSHIDNQNCYVCHADVVDEDLKIINSSKHIDGLLNLFGKDIKY